MRGSMTTELKELIAIREALEGGQENNLLSLTPYLSRITGATNETVSTGARFVSIFVETGTGTVLGTTVSEGMEIVFPYFGGEWGAIAYSVDTNSSFLIQEGH